MLGKACKSLQSQGGKQRHGVWSQALYGESAGTRLAKLPLSLGTGRGGGSMELAVRAYWDGAIQILAQSISVLKFCAAWLNITLKPGRSRPSRQTYGLGERGFQGRC